jgi:hypothetical protein
MWVLIWISLLGEPSMSVLGIDRTMNECFLRREAELVKKGRYTGKFKQGTTAICVYRKEYTEVEEK